MFNMGLGMVLVCAPEAVETIRGMVPDARVVGEVVPRSDEARVVIQ